MVTTVFISSTSSDLKEYRAGVRESLLNAGYHPVDMADFMARAEGAQSACLNEVAEADMFVGIYAWRYGFVPPKSKISITEQEYEEARRLEKPCFCFFVEDNYEWPAQFKEEGKGGELLKAFKAKLDATLVRTTFTTPDSLAKKVLSTLARWEKEQHKLTIEAATEMLKGVESVDDAQGLITDVLNQREIEFEMNEDGCFLIDHGSTFLTIEVFSDDRLGVLVDFRAALATNVDHEKIPADVAIQMLAENWTSPLGAIAFNPTSATMWYSYRIPVSMLNDEITFSCMSYVASIADDLDDTISELLPTRQKPRSRQKE